MNLFDSHCHLQDDRIGADAAAVMARARASGVRAMLCCGSSEADWDAVKELSRRYPDVIPAFGIHPWYIKDRSPLWRTKLERRLLEFGEAAVGEIGLDHALDERDDEDQAAVFMDQLQLAQKLGRPVSIHCRKAWAPLLTILASHGLPDGGVIHSYSGAPELVPQFEKLGASISFSGSITYDRNKRGRASAAIVSDNRLLIETDSPDISPRGIAEGKNEPSNLGKIAEALAVLRGVSVEEIAELTCRNACKILKKH